MTELLRAAGVTKEFAQPGQDVTALADVDLVVQTGEFVLVTGASGSGKSTLLSLLGAMDVPTRGSIHLLGHALAGASGAGLAELRRDHVGFVFQDFRLVRHLTAIENVRLPLLFSERSGGEDRADELLERFGLSGRRDHRPEALSRGEMQRVALARALVNRPRVLFADEPTANLDAKNGEVIHGLLSELNAAGDLSIVLATHGADHPTDAGRVVRLEHGRIVADERR